jgi:hypothetical protein
VLKKLKLGERSPVLILNAPPEYGPVVADIPGVVHATPQGAYDFVQLFVRNAAEVGQYADVAMESVAGDGYFWVCYPKKTSKRYKADITRDQGWDALRAGGFEGVAMVSLDDDWSAMRFRRVQYTKRRES